MKTIKRFTAKTMLFAAATLTVACGGGEKENNTMEFTVVDAHDILTAPQTEAFTLNDIAESVKVVPIVAGEGALLPTLHCDAVMSNGDVVMTGDDKIFIVDSESGEVKSVINRKGRGPNEYINLLGVSCVDEVIYVSDTNGKKLLAYDADGNCQKSVSTQELMIAGSIYVLDHNTFIYSNSLYGNLGEELSYFHVVDSLMQPKAEYVPYKVSQKADVTITSAPIRCSEGMAFDVNPQLENDTIYYADGGGLRPIIVTVDNGHPLKTEWKETRFGESSYSYIVKSVNVVYDWIYGDMICGRVDSKSLGSRNFILRNGEVLASMAPKTLPDGTVKNGFPLVLGSGDIINVSIMTLLNDRLFTVLDGYHLEGIVDGITEDSNPVMVVLKLK